MFINNTCDRMENKTKQVTKTILAEIQVVIAIARLLAGQQLPQNFLSCKKHLSLKLKCPKILS